MSQLLQARDKYIRFARSILSNIQDAEDIVQDCYVKWYARVQAGEVANAEAYMMRAVRNASLDHLRRQCPEALQETHELHIEIGADVLRQIDKAEQAQRLERMMALLSEKQRSVFYLRDVAGYELQEIETVTGMSNEAVRTALSRARKQLKLLYEKAGTHSGY